MSDMTMWKLQTEFEVIDAALQATLSADFIPRYEFKRDQITNASAKYSLILTYLEKPEEYENTWTIDSLRIQVNIRKLGKELTELGVSDSILYTTSEDSHSGETSFELERWQKMRDHAIKYIIEGLRRDDAWHPQVIERGHQEGLQPTETNAPAGSVITRTLPAFDCVVSKFFTWLTHYTSDAMLRRFPAKRGYIRINPLESQHDPDLIHAIKFIEFTGRRGFDADDEAGPQEIDYPMWLIRLDIVYVPKRLGEDRITIKAQCSEPAVRVYFDELLQAISDNWIKAASTHNGQPVAASASDQATLPKGGLIAEDKLSIDVPTFEGLLATLDDCTCQRVGQVGALVHWKISMMNGGLPLGYVSALPVGDELWLGFYMMEWDIPRNGTLEMIGEDGQLWQSVREPSSAWSEIMRGKVIGAIDAVLGSKPRVSAETLLDTDQLVTGNTGGWPNTGDKRQGREQNKGGRPHYKEDAWAADELAQHTPVFSVN